MRDEYIRRNETIRKSNSNGNVYNYGVTTFSEFIIPNYFIPVQSLIVCSVVLISGVLLSMWGDIILFELDVKAILISGITYYRDYI